MIDDDPEFSSSVRIERWMTAEQAKAIYGITIIDDAPEPELTAEEVAAFVDSFGKLWTAPAVRRTAFHANALYEEMGAKLQVKHIRAMKAANRPHVIKPIDGYYRPIRVHRHEPNSYRSPTLEAIAYKAQRAMYETSVCPPYRVAGFPLTVSSIWMKAHQEEAWTLERVRRTAGR